MCACKCPRRHPAWAVGGLRQGGLPLQEASVVWPFLAPVQLQNGAWSGRRHGVGAEDAQCWVDPRVKHILGTPLLCLVESEGQDQGIVRRGRNAKVMPRCRWCSASRPHTGRHFSFLLAPTCLTIYVAGSGDLSQVMWPAQNQAMNSQQLLKMLVSQVSAFHLVHHLKSMGVIISECAGSIVHKQRQSKRECWRFRWSSLPITSLTPNLFKPFQLCSVAL